MMEISLEEQELEVIYESVQSGCGVGNATQVDLPNSRPSSAVPSMGIALPLSFIPKIFESALLLEP